VSQPIRPRIVPPSDVATNSGPSVYGADALSIARDGAVDVALGRGRRDAPANSVSPQLRRAGIDYERLLRVARERNERAARLLGKCDASSGGLADVNASGTKADPQDMQHDASRQQDTAANPAEDHVPDSVCHLENKLASDPDYAYAGDFDTLVHAGGPETLRLATLAREQRLSGLSAPFLAQLAQQQAQVARLMHFLADRLADFCCDEAIIANGNWTIDIQLAATLLPDCALRLTLSHFDLMLRFKVSDQMTQKILLLHKHLLRNRLVALLNQLATPRDVQIDIT